MTDTSLNYSDLKLFVANFVCDFNGLSRNWPGTIKVKNYFYIV